MYDVHSRSNDLKLLAPSSGRHYNGGVDGIVAPYALTKAGAFTEMRIVYEHKQSIAQKQLYREANPSQFKVRCIRLSITYHRSLSQVVASAYGGWIWRKCLTAFQCCAHTDFGYAHALPKCNAGLFPASLLVDFAGQRNIIY